jgi:hypothetical protein
MWIMACLIRDFVRPLLAFQQYLLIPAKVRSTLPRFDSTTKSFTPDRFPHRLQNPAERLLHLSFCKFE